jgi:hypothetical protein
MEIIGLTICVNYSDILFHMLQQNSQFLKKWYIVTSPDDTQTIDLIHKTNLSNIEVLKYDEFYNNSLFNKSGAVKFAQEYIYNNYTETNILILDADIFLPDHFAETLPVTLEQNALYGLSERVDYWTLDDFKNNTNPRIHPHGSNFQGCFQLYRQCPITYTNHSSHCGDCDYDFRGLFQKHIHLKLSAKHLGQEHVNWGGRRSVLF